MADRSFNFKVEDILEHLEKPLNATRMVVVSETQRERSALQVFEGGGTYDDSPIAELNNYQIVQGSLTPENISLYRSIFKGRDDVVPEHWKSNGEDNKFGYAPLCHNKWKTGLCNLKIKGSSGCKTCENSQPIKLSDELIEEHIMGKKILGVYPLLQDNTCYFIAADFDKHKPTDSDPIEDVKKYVAVCEVQEIPCYVLRSKSGNGFHAYVFFSDAVPAWKARTVCNALLVEAGVIGDDVEPTSFDRLFPNQTELSGKGLGNLISRPFQGKAMANGHTLILDPETNFLSPYNDQWGALNTVGKVTEKDLDTIIKEWDLKKEDTARKDKIDHAPVRKEEPGADFNKIQDGCEFIKHCCDDAENLSEPEWYVFLTIVGRCEDGRSLAHKHSERYSSYTHAETEAKLDHALSDTGPYTCKRIQTKLKSPFCKKCPSRVKVKSPIVLGRDAGNQSGSDDTGSSYIDEFNEKHAVIMVGGKCLVLNEVTDPIFGRPDITFSSFPDFQNYYSNRKIKSAENPGKRINTAKKWIESEGRREYPGGIVFEPSGTHQVGTYNLWKGFAVEPKKGDWSLFEEHILLIIAGGNRTVFEYIIAWLARIIQDPGGKRPGTAIVLRGKQGTGKGIFVNIFGRVFGKHFIQIAQSSQVTGRFNHHLKDALLVFVDEGFCAGDKQSEGVIKNMITEHFITVEQKGKDIFRVANHINLIISSNNDWIVPAGPDERRFFVLDVADTKHQDHGYFEAIENQMDNGGLEGMFFDLLNMNISGVNLRKFEQTEGLFEQKFHSMPTVLKYWYERLINGNLISTARESEQTSGGTELNDWNPKVRTDEQHKDYLAFAKEMNERSPLCDTQFGRALKKVCKSIRKPRARKNGERINVRVFPSLEQCRKEFGSFLKMDIDWEEKRDAA